MTQKAQNRQILVVEDEGLVAAFLCEALADRGYRAQSVDNGADALAFMRDHPADLVLMDIEIKGPLDGIQTAAEIRRIAPAPVIFLTAYKDDDTIISAIDQKPSAYLIKPVTEAELIAAVMLAFSKNEPQAPKLEARCPYRFDQENGLLYEGQTPIPLSKMERQLAALLFEKPGRLIAQEHILQHCWPNEEPAPGSLRNLVFKLRRKLPDVTIETLKDTGYRVVPQRL